MVIAALEIQLTESYSDYRADPADGFIESADTFMEDLPVSTLILWLGFWTILF